MEIELDKLVVYLGSAMYWPIAWPGLVTNPALQRTIPDYVFAIYVAFMVAFCLASGLFGDPRYRPAQRRGAIGMGAVMRGKLFLDLRQPFVEQRDRPRIKRRKRTNDPRLALRDHEIGIRDDEERRADHRHRQSFRKRPWKSHAGLLCSFDDEDWVRRLAPLAGVRAPRKVSRMVSM